MSDTKYIVFVERSWIWSLFSELGDGQGNISNVKVISGKSMDGILWTASGKRRNFDEQLMES